MAEKIKMVDLQGQYMRIRDEVDAGIREVIGSAAFINGPAVGQFRENLGRYLGGIHVIPCANGTDALFIALLSLGLKPGGRGHCPGIHIRLVGRSDRPSRG